MTGPGRRYRRVGTVTARRLEARVEWTTESGDALKGEPGDWLVESAEGAARTVDDEQFHKTHEHVSGDQWRRGGDVGATSVTESRDVVTHEGVAHARTGDWILTSDDGWSWPVPDRVFRSSYEPADPTPEGSPG